MKKFCLTNMLLLAIITVLFLKFENKVIVLNALLTALFNADMVITLYDKYCKEPIRNLMPIIKNLVLNRRKALPHPEKVDNAFNLVNAFLAGANVTMLVVALVIFCTMR